MEAPPLPLAVPNPNRFTETDHSKVYYLDLIDDRYWLTNIRTLLGPTPIRCPFTPLYFRAFLPLCTLADVPPSHPPSLLPHTLSKAEPRGGHPTPPQAYISLGATQSRTLQTPRNRTKTPGQSPSTAFPASPHTLQSMSGSPSYRYAPLADSEWTTWDRQLPNPARVLLELDLDFGIVPPTGGQGEKVGRVGGRWVRRERWRKASSSHPPFSPSIHFQSREDTREYEARGGLLVPLLYRRRPLRPLGYQGRGRGSDALRHHGFPQGRRLRVRNGRDGDHVSEWHEAAGFRRDGTRRCSYSHK